MHHLIIYRNYHLLYFNQNNVGYVHARAGVIRVELTVSVMGYDDMVWQGSYLLFVLINYGTHQYSFSNVYYADYSFRSDSDYFLSKETGC